MWPKKGDYHKSIPKPNIRYEIKFKNTEIFGLEILFWFLFFLCIFQFFISSVFFVWISKHRFCFVYIWYPRYESLLPINSHSLYFVKFFNTKIFVRKPMRRWTKKSASHILKDERKSLEKIKYTFGNFYFSF